ncbi:acetate--CoA ligase family protein [Aeromicrobium piscarium]|uniref:CoA-binding protein n=1 Tax=Aeromicrobium piscarium TaxID=2590901 RepID=A0A554SA46_9ACTN|nr:acetate--CoA ligase family protein [Aeromicrobium piscarium]TSD63203.1 CoA-binding protein [Aeromicrobium piscarium]
MENLDLKRSRGMQGSAVPSGSGSVGEWEAKELLRSRGIAVPSGTFIPLEASRSPVAPSFAGPYVVKAVSPTLVHKSDAGGVRVGVTDAQSLVAVMADVETSVSTAGHEVTGFIVERMAESGQELVVGAVRVPGVGWSLMVGLGGTMIELLEDVAFGIVPVREDDVRRMLSDLKVVKLLHGFRGAVPADVDGFVELVMNVAGPGGFLESLPENVVEVDLNPVIVGPSSATVVDARLICSDPVAAAPNGLRDRVDLERLLSPRVVAVLGASTTTKNVANNFIRNMLEYGFQGRIVPVHPTAAEIEGLPAFASLDLIDEEVDYAYVAVGAARVVEVLSTSNRVHFAQVISSGFAETADGSDLQERLLAVARENEIRVLGPNCIGTLSPAGRLTFLDRAPREEGSISVISQSGGLSVDVVRLGANRGVAFRSVISIGNAADLTPAEAVEFFLDDPETSAIGVYLESLANARQLLDVLRQRAHSKPVVLLAGGRTKDGSAAAVSHTGAIASDYHLWPAIARQAGVHLVDTIHDFVHVLGAFQAIDAAELIPGGGVLLFGNGGGTSVLAADAFSRAGLTVPTLSASIVADLESLGLPPGNGLSNPIDTPAGTLLVEGGAVAERILRTALQGAVASFLVAHINVGVILSNASHLDQDVLANLIDSVAKARSGDGRQIPAILVLRSDGDAAVDAAIRTHARRARDLGIPVVSELMDAAVVARALDDHCTQILNIEREQR